MSVDFAPSTIKTLCLRFLQKVPYIRKYMTRKSINKLYRLAKKAAEYNHTIQILDSTWAVNESLDNDEFKRFTSELLIIDKMIGNIMFGRVYPSLHWSRVFEYPYSLSKLQLPDKPLMDFRILDCGSSIGPLQFAIAEKGYNYYSLDLNLKDLSQVALIKSKNDLKTLHPTYGNILELPFPNDYFDRVVSISVLEHIIFPLKNDLDIIFKGFINELLRVLKPGGLVILTFDVNMSSEKSTMRLYYREYVNFCKIIGINPTEPPSTRLFSSDSEEGRFMGEDLCTFCITFTYK